MTLPASKPAKPHLIFDSGTVEDALRIINSVQPKIALVVEADGALIRTVTDGDVRRGMLGGIELGDCVAKLPGREPVALPITATLSELRDVMRRAMVSAIVLLDDEGRPNAIADHAAAGDAILLSPPHMGARELALIHEAFDDNWIAPAGPNLARFEQALAQTSGRDHALAVSSGTAALHLAMRALGVSQGDRVYVSNLTFVASLQPVLYEKAVPVLIDSEPHSWNMSPCALERQLARDDAANCLPKAIILVHLYGQPAEMEQIIQLAARYDIPVVEDAAESLGASYHNRPSGNHGVLSAYSFNGNKIITTSGGGALVGDDAHLMEIARNLSTQGREPAEHYQHECVAYNYRMSNVLAGIGVGQLELLGERVAARRAIYQRYVEGFSDIDGIGFQGEVAGSLGNRWLTVVTLDPDKVPLHAYQLIRGLKEAGIEARPGWKPMHMQPLCRGFAYVPHSLQEDVSSGLFLQSVCLPSGSALEEGGQARIIDQFRKLVRGH